MDMEIVKLFLLNCFCPTSLSVSRVAESGECHLLRMLLKPQRHR